MRTHFGTFRTASAITKQTAERFRLQTANSTRQIRRIIFPTSAFAPSASREIGEFSSAFSGAIAPIRQAQPPLDLTHVFWEGTNRRPPRRLIQPLGIEGNAMVTLTVYVDIEPMSKIQNMLLVSPSLWRGYLGLRVDPGPMFQQKIREAIETLEAFGYGISEPDDRNVLIRDAQTISRLYPTEYAAVLGAIPTEATVVE